MRFAYRPTAENDQTVEVDIVPQEGSPDGYHATVGARSFDLSARLLHRAAVHKQAGVVTVQYEGQEYRLFDAAQRRRSGSQHRGDLHAPMAGKVIRVLVQPGERIQAGATLVILEAMKMEQPVVAPQDGVIAQVLCREGDQVPAGMELVVLAAEENVAPAAVTAPIANPETGEP
jgi:3-methylcrotonyl-CoA carboxylase alpha subunit